MFTPLPVRTRAKEIVELLGDLDRVRAERRKAKANRNKYTGTGSETSSFTTGSSRYGGFGNEGAGGGYAGGDDGKFRNSDRGDASNLLDVIQNTTVVGPRHLETTVRDSMNTTQENMKVGLHARPIHLHPRGYPLYPTLKHLAILLHRCQFRKQSQRKQLSLAHQKWIFSMVLALMVRELA